MPPSMASPGSPLANIPVEIRICVGTARPTMAQLMVFEQDTVVELDRSVNDPVELFVGERLIARGELEELGEEGTGRLAVRLTEVIDLDRKT